MISWQVKSNLKGTKHLEAAAKAELSREARAWLEETKVDLQAAAPYKTGYLHDSVRIEPATGEIPLSDGGFKLVLVIDAPYAAYNNRGMREDGSRRIKNRPSGGKDGWVDEVFLRRAPEFLPRLTRALRGIARSGRRRN